jgi:predicted dinucleotide-binding enzyme
MRIAIIGAGNVGGALALGWARAGHEIRLGVRKPADPKVTRLLGQLARPGIALPPADAVRDADVVVLATPWDATLELARHLPLAGKLVIDTTNPLLPNLAGLAVAGNTSGGEEVARAAPGATVVKCFNTTGAGNFVAPVYPDGAATMLYAGDDPAAKAVVAELGRELGFAMLDAGPLARARLLEPFAMLWITLAYPQGQGREIAFRLMRR